MKASTSGAARLGGGLSYACPSSAAPLHEDAVDHLLDTLDRQFMGEALRLAARIPRRPWPNPPVGALIVRDGEVVGRGAHHGAGTDHAETVALREAGDRARGATLYCTLEPCNHHGRTPPCAPAVCAAGIARVVVAMRDPNPSVAGGGVALLERSGVAVTLGVMAETALDLVWPFAATAAFTHPYVVLKTATSLDGFFAPRAGDGAAGPDGRVYLTGLDARRDVHRLRRWCDTVLVGEGTMRADRPQLDGRLVDAEAPCPSEDPVPAYCDTDLSLGDSWTRPHWVFAGRSGSPERRRQIEARGGRIVECETSNGQVDPRSLVARFAELGGRVLLLEGGPSLASSFLREDLVDRWVSYVAPVTLGSGVCWPDTHGRHAFHATRVDLVGGDARTVFDRVRFADLLTAVSASAGAR